MEKGEIIIYQAPDSVNNQRDIIKGIATFRKKNESDGLLNPKSRRDDMCITVGANLQKKASLNPKSRRDDTCITVGANLREKASLKTKSRRDDIMNQIYIP